LERGEFFLRGVALLLDTPMGEKVNSFRIVAELENKPEIC
jgi:hypothetical protein